MAIAGSLGIVAGGGGGGGGGGSGLTTPVTLTVANSSSQSGSDFSDASGYLQGGWSAGTDGVAGVNNHLWDDILIWDLASLFGVTFTVADSPVLALDWLTQTHPAEASILGFGFCVAANAGAAASDVASRWTNLYNDGSNEEGSQIKRNRSSGNGGVAVKSSPLITRCSAILLGNAWAYAVSNTDHGDSGTDPTGHALTSVNTLTSSEKLFAFISGGPKSTASGNITWAGTFKAYYGGGAT